MRLPCYPLWSKKLTRTRFTKPLKLWCKIRNTQRQIRHWKMWATHKFILWPFKCCIVVWNKQTKNLNVRGEIEPLFLSEGRSHLSSLEGPEVHCVSKVEEKTQSKHAAVMYDKSWCTEPDEQKGFFLFTYRGFSFPRKLWKQQKQRNKALRCQMTLTCYALWNRFG